ncbi:MAG: PIG-L family deacetylase [Candidatus Nomurabacteria bacterium]|nr:PIG-L family deacetylase [Candidatus Nomurabacteria bacterium]
MKKNFLIIIFFVLLAGSLVYFTESLKFPTEQNTTTPFTIILSPHLDDAVLSLGGLIAKKETNILVATFFTKKPTEIMHTYWDKISGFKDSDEAMLARTKENENALSPFKVIIKNYDHLDSQYREKNKDKEIEEKISKDIENLIKTYQNRELLIYGPATFGAAITHPDHQIIHDAFMDVFKKYKTQNAHFFIYEDFPYIKQFTTSSLGDLNTYLEKKENVKFQENPIELSEPMLSEKIVAIEKYKSQVRAFLSLDSNIGIIDEKFSKDRCRIFMPQAYACEVIHSLP